MSSPLIRTLVVSAAAVLTLAACGGGAASSSSPQTTPRPTPNTADDRVTVDQVAVPGAAEGSSSPPVAAFVTNYSKSRAATFVQISATEYNQRGQVVGITYPGIWTIGIIRPGQRLPIAAATTAYNNLLANPALGPVSRAVVQTQIGGWSDKDPNPGATIQGANLAVSPVSTAIRTGRSPRSE